MYFMMNVFKSEVYDFRVSKITNNYQALPNFVSIAPYELLREVEAGRPIEFAQSFCEI